MAVKALCILMILYSAISLGTLKDCSGGEDFFPFVLIRELSTLFLAIGILIWGT